MGSNIRWLQRLENFGKAYGLLRQVFDERSMEELSVLELEGVVQRFEYTYELAWKTLKDYLDFSGINVDPVTPRTTARKGFEAGLIEDGQAWMDMIADRNRMAHTYDQAAFDAVTTAIHDRYIPAIGQLHAILTEKACASE